MYEVEVQLSAKRLGGTKEGTVLCGIKTCLTRNLCKCIFYFNGEICGIPENVPRFMKMPFIFLKSTI